MNLIEYVGKNRNCGHIEVQKAILAALNSDLRIARGATNVVMP